MDPVTSATQARTGDAVAISVLKKALDIQSQNAQALLSLLPEPARSNPPHLGQHVDIRV